MIRRLACYLAFATLLVAAPHIVLPQSLSPSPTVLVMIAEQQIGQERLLFWWSIFDRGPAEFKAEQTSLGIVDATLNNKLREAGFRPVDTSLKQGDIAIDKSYAIIDLTDTSAQTVGRSLGADIVIIGKALTRKGAPLAGSDMHNVHANATARVIRVSNGEVVASGTAAAAGLHVDETTAGTLALKQAATELADHLIEQLRRMP